MQRGRGRAKKFPAIKHNYESVVTPGIFFAGAVSHSLDFRKSAGGFIHGFRYTGNGRLFCTLTIYAKVGGKI